MRHARHHLFRRQHTIRRTFPNRSSHRLVEGDMSARRMFVLLVACLIAWPAAARANECMPVFDPLQVLTLNLQLSQRDWDTIRKDTTFDIEMPATFWADGETGI